MDIRDHKIVEYKTIWVTFSSMIYLMVFPLKKSISKFEYDVPLIPLISMKYVIEVIAIPPKIDERINDFFSNLNVKINLEIH